MGSAAKILVDGNKIGSIALALEPEDCRSKSVVVDHPC
jgi:hypothetical protein